ncbi:hypothetical protein KM043_017423 [Ampulex compressa]|nr:hypothetical protein KM043_017423 [Ampulex compressa]
MIHNSPEFTQPRVKTHWGLGLASERSVPLRRGRLRGQTTRAARVFEKSRGGHGVVTPLGGARRCGLAESAQPGSTPEARPIGSSASSPVRFVMGLPPPFFRSPSTARFPTGHAHEEWCRAAARKETIRAPRGV